MKILEVYRKFSLTKTLQEHMIRAAAVGKVIAENSLGININQKKIIRVLLLHDTGNIIKFDFNKFPNLLGSEINEIDFWKNTQKKFIEQYGHDEHKATEIIAREIGVSLEIQTLLETQIYTSTKKIAQEMNWEAKICDYSDLRCGPFGVISLDERYDDLINRYKHRNHKISNIKQTEENHKYMLIIEEQLQRHCKIELKKITEESVKNLYSSLQETNI